MRTASRKSGRSLGRADTLATRIATFRWIVIALFVLMAGRLFVLQVLSHSFYNAVAADQRGIFEQLFPERGAILLTDPTSETGTFPAAVNRPLSTVYANTRTLKDAPKAAAALSPLLQMTPEELLPKLSRPDDPYEPLKAKVPDEVVEQIRSLKLDGIGFAREQSRFYPEKSAVSHVLGFVGRDESGKRVGRYGIEGWWDTQLTGSSGFVAAERDPIGRWIGAAPREFIPARDGDTLVLTIDRTIQYVACEKLRAAVLKHGAEGGSVVVLNPHTGAVMAMCGMPDYDPNEYGSVESVAQFNNPAIFSPYEPGSIFKPITMAAAIDAGKVTPNSWYNDEGSVKIGPYTIKNSDGKANGMQTMTQVLEKSLNTGMIYASGLMGSKAFLQYVENFGFGTPTGIELNSESAGDIESLRKKGDIWTATGSFGQGITTTPLQMAAAYTALANGGKLMRPYVVAEARHYDDTVTRTEPTVVRQVITKRASTLVGGMLVNVVENGHGKKAGVPGYWVAGKTGTAQVVGANGKYEAHAFIGSFAGYAPVDNPAFVMVVQVIRPKDVDWAESSAAPLFGDIAAFLLQYLQIPPERS